MPTVAAEFVVNVMRCGNHLGGVGYTDRYASVRSIWVYLRDSGSAKARTHSSSCRFRLKSWSWRGRCTTGRRSRGGGGNWCGNNQRADRAAIAMLTLRGRRSAVLAGLWITGGGRTARRMSSRSLRASAERRGFAWAPPPRFRSASFPVTAPFGARV